MPKKEGTITVADDVVAAAEKILLRSKEMTTENRVTVCVWPDGTWCREEDIEKYQYKSDDYTKITADENSIEEAVCRFITI